MSCYGNALTGVQCVLIGTQDTVRPSSLAMAMASADAIEDDDWWLHGSDVDEGEDECSSTAKRKRTAADEGVVGIKKKKRKRHKADEITVSFKQYRKTICIQPVYYFKPTLFLRAVHVCRKRHS